MQKFLAFLFLFALTIGPLRADTATANTGQNVTIVLQFVSGTLPFSYQWMKNGQNIPGATSASYVIASAAVTDSATYTCTVTNAAGSTVSDAALITVAPAIVAPSGCTTHTTVN